MQSSSLQIFILSHHRQKHARPKLFTDNLYKQKYARLISSIKLKKKNC